MRCLVKSESTVSLLAVLLQRVCRILDCSSKKNARSTKFDIMLQYSRFMHLLNLQKCTWHTLSQLRRSTVLDYFKTNEQTKRFANQQTKRLKKQTNKHQTIHKTNEQTRNDSQTNKRNDSQNKRTNKTKTRTFILSCNQINFVVRMELPDPFCDTNDTTRLNTNLILLIQVKLQDHAKIHFVIRIP